MIRSRRAVRTPLHLALAALVAALALAASPGRAAAGDGDTATGAPTDAAADADAARMKRARFSGKRLAAEIVVGELIGGLVSYGTYNATCDGEDCFGAAGLAFAADFAVTPLAVWATGKAMGGQGRLLYSYLGASVAVTPLSVPGSPDETPAETLHRIDVAMAVSAILMPICSAVLYEVSSHVASVRWQNEHQPVIAINPIRGKDGVDGAMGSLAFAF